METITKENLEMLHFQLFADLKELLAGIFHHKPNNNIPGHVAIKEKE